MNFFLDSIQLSINLLFLIVVLGTIGISWIFSDRLRKRHSADFPWNKAITIIVIPTLRTCFDTFWYFYDKPASRKDSHRIGEIWSCELRFYFPLVFFLVHLKLLTQCRDHAGLRNKYRNRKSEVRSIGLLRFLSG